MIPDGESGGAPLLFAKEYGSFDLEWLQMKLGFDPKEYLDPARIEAFRSSTSEWDRITEFALGQAAYFHELRHFHDAFGTLAGIQLFQQRMLVLQTFIELAPVLFKNRKPWVLPLTRAAVTDLPPEAWKFIRHALNVLRVCRRFRGDLPSLFREEVPPDPIPHVSRLSESMFNTMVYAFPARVDRITGDEVRHELLHIPITFNTLLEGNAQVIQRDLIESMWGDQIALKVFVLSGASVRDLDKPEEAACHPAYNVTDLMVSRFMENETGNRSFPRSTLLALTDGALTAATLVSTQDEDGTRSVQMNCAGHVFVDLLSEVGAEAIRAGEIPIPPPLDEGYRFLRDNYAAVSSYETVDETVTGPLADTQILVSWVAREIITPLLDARLRTQHRVFSDARVWMTECPKLPSVPFLIRPDGTSVSNAPSRVFKAWLRLRMIERMFAQLITGASAILCPRAHRTAPGIENVNFAHEGDCRDYVEAELCGRFHTGMPLTALPACDFRDHLGRLGFSLPSGQTGSRS